MPPRGRRRTLRQVWKAIRQLHPGRAAREARQQFTLALVGMSEEEVSVIREFLLGVSPSRQDIECADKVLSTNVCPLDEAKLREIRSAELILATDEAKAELGRLSNRAVSFDFRKPGQSVRAIAAGRRGTDLRLALARCLPVFRPVIARRIVREVSGENAVFVIATALGNVVPSVFQPLLGVAEAASDMVFLTANQIRMLFMMGAVYGANVGYTSQWREAASIVGAAFGWRSLARNLVSKIPFGGGLVPKGAVAYAGTAVVGEGLIFLYTTGRRMTREEVRQTFKRVYSEAVGTVRSLTDKLRSEAPGSGKASD